MRPDDARLFPRAVLLAATLVVIQANAACNVDPYCITCADEDGGVDDDAFNDDGGDGDGDGGDGDGDGDAGPVPDACIPSQPICDDMDNDCDGDVDEGFDKQNDPENCGSCGNVCSRTGANGTCESGGCVYECKPNSYDLNGDLNAVGSSNGCEYFCNPPHPDEGGDGLDDTCDLADDDCDNEIDEDVDKLNDELNCGTCGTQCVGINATPMCVGGTCDPTCEEPPAASGCECDLGFRDVTAAIAGCEYQCPDSDPTTPGVQPPTAPGDEDCDGVDNDCDGATDELPINGLGQDCTDPGFESFADTGACEFGQVGCNFGTETCIGYVRPQAEVCEAASGAAADIDCDGVDDNGFNKLTDPRYCENCAGCFLSNAIPKCTAGACGIQTCLPGFVNADGIVTNGTSSVPGNGCEYACTPSGPEVCDGIDNDCDTFVDEPGASPGGIGSPPAGLCKQTGACNGTVAECAATPCDAVVKWRCIYDAPVELQGNPLCGVIADDESVCDGYFAPPNNTPTAADDGDCDGLFDESFAVGPQTGSCSESGVVGICQGTGNTVCAPTMDAELCNITSPGQTQLDGELCNNLDDDCDGEVDNDDLDDEVFDYMVQIGTTGKYIDVYEASRPDADDTLQGSADHMACSNPDVMPWRSVDYNEALAMCTAAGKRLCTEAEWQDACDGTVGAGGNLYPYGGTTFADYVDDYCNGKDFDPDCSGNVDEILVTTGFMYVCPVPQADTCVSAFDAYDMSGNLSEWTSTQVGTAPVTRRVKGGNYNTIKQGLTCSHSFVSFQQDDLFPNLGFRCCADSAPPAEPQPVP